MVGIVMSSSPIVAEIWHEVYQIAQLLYTKLSGLLAQQSGGDSSAVERGVLQRHPLRPSMFGLSFLPTLQRAKEGSPESLVIAIHKDTCVQVDEELSIYRCFRATSATAARHSDHNARLYDGQP